MDDVRFVRRKHLDQLAGCRDAQAARQVARQRDAPQPDGGEANDTMATLSRADGVALGSGGYGSNAVVRRCGGAGIRHSLPWAALTGLAGSTAMGWDPGP